MMGKMKCTMGFHEYETVDGWFDFFRTNYKDINLTKYWIVYLSRCKNCGNRKLETECPKKDGYYDHKGIEQLRYFWEDKGRIPPRHPNNNNKKTKNTSSSRKNSIYSEKVEKLVSLALDTPHEQEAISTFKKARSVYKNDKNSN